MFNVDVDTLEIVARTTIVYLALLVLLRIGGKREMGQMTPFDLVVILLISEAVQSSMVGGDISLVGGLVAATVLLAVNYAVASAKDRLPPLRSLFESEPTVLVRDGRMLRKNLESEGLTEDELMSAIRHNGVEEVSGVRLATLEPDGAISVVKANGESKRKRRGPFGRRR